MARQQARQVRHGRRLSAAADAQVAHADRPGGEDGAAGPRADRRAGGPSDMRVKARSTAV